MTRPPVAAPLVRARLHPADLVRVGAVGLRTRPLRAVLSALGIAIGIAVMVAVVGITSSGRADLDRALDRLGTNLLRVGAGQQAGGGAAQLPADAEAMISRIGPVTNVTAVGSVAGAHVYRTDRVPQEQSNGIVVLAARLSLIADVSVTVHSGSWLTEATARFPTVVLGAKSAQWLGITEPDTQIWLAWRWFTVIGILDPAPLAEELDVAALIGWDAAVNLLGFDGHPSTVYVRSKDASVAAVRAVLARTADPEHPDEVRVSRPSDALSARAAADKAFAGLLLGLGAVALLVGGIGVANTMVISVLERRAEIGLRRALGARRGQIRVQFVVESLLLSALGGGTGAALGVAATTVYATGQGWPTLVPSWASFGGVGATLIIGALAGLYPAMRAAAVPPTEALAS